MKRTMGLSTERDQTELMFSPGSSGCFLLSALPAQKERHAQQHLQGVSKRPWLDIWWSFLLGFMCRLSLLSNDSLHLDNLRDC